MDPKSNEWASERLDFVATGTLAWHGPHLHPRSSINNKDDAATVFCNVLQGEVQVGTLRASIAGTPAGAACACPEADGPS